MFDDRNLSNRAAQEGRFRRPSVCRPDLSADRNRNRLGVDRVQSPELSRRIRRQGTERSLRKIIARSGDEGRVSQGSPISGEYQRLERGRSDRADFGGGGFRRHASRRRQLGGPRRVEQAAFRARSRSLTARCFDGKAFTDANRSIGGEQPIGQWRGWADCGGPGRRRRGGPPSRPGGLPRAWGGPAGGGHIPTAMMVAPVKPPASPARIFLVAFAASAARPSAQIATFTAHTKAIMVTMAAASAAHHGLGLKRRTRMKTRIANGMATSAMRTSPAVPLIR